MLPTVNFFLTGFSDQLPSNHKMTASVSLDSKNLICHFEFVPPLTPFERNREHTPKRKTHLWENHCFELFFCIENHPEYWEVNAHPNGDWNLFSFSGYRNGMKEEKRVTEINTRVIENSKEKFEFQMTVPSIHKLIEWNLFEKIQVQPTFVFKNPNGTYEYFAPKHLREKPDFHWRGGFVSLDKTRN